MDRLLAALRTTDAHDRRTGGLWIGDRYLTPAQVEAIRRRNAARTVPPGPHSVHPMSADEATVMAAAGRGSGVIDPTRTATDPATVANLQQQFGGPGVAGREAFSYTLGRHIAAHVPGVTPRPGFEPTASGTVRDLAMVLPWLRAPRAALRAAQAARAGGTPAAARAAARASWSEPGPHPLQLLERAAENPKLTGAERRLLRLLVGRPSRSADETVRQLQALTARMGLEERRRLRERLLARREAKRQPGIALPHAIGGIHAPPRGGRRTLRETYRPGP